MRIEEGLLYTREHEWIKVEGNIGIIGIADYAQEHLGDIVYVELPEVGDEIGKGDSFSSVESVKAATDVFMPVGGKITEVNSALEDDPAMLNQDAYANWIAKIEITDTKELEDLMGAADYNEFASKED